MPAVIHAAPRPFIVALALALALAALPPPEGLRAEPRLIEETVVVGRRDLLAIPGADAAARLSFDDQLSLNRTVGDWIEALPGVSLNGQGGLYQAYSVRGFSRWRIRTELNGVPIITDRRAGNAVAFLPPDLIAQVAVEKAASSTLYGSGAMGGVVSLGTARADTPRVLAEARSNDRQMALTALGGLADGLSGGISARRAGRAETPDGERLNTGFEQVAGLLSGDALLGDLELSYSWVGGAGRDIGKSNSLYPERRVSSYPREEHSLTQLELRAAGDWLLRGYHHFQDWEADVERVGERRNLTRYRGHTVGGLFYRSTAGLGGTGSLGLEWIGRRGVVISEREFTAADLPLSTQQVLSGDEDTLGVFADQRWARDALSVTAGLRLDGIRQSADERDDSDLQWSASAGLDYLLASAWTVSAELASAYRFPGLSERYFTGVTPRGEVLGNPDLNPETRRNLELGLSYASDADRLSGSVAFYYSDLGDYIERYAVNDRLLSFRNLDGARIAGAEVDLSLRSGPFIHRLSYQWQEGEDDDGNTLADLNPPGWRYFLRWQGERRALSSDLSYRNPRDEFGAGEASLDSALIWNARVTRELSRDWRGELYINNILDEAYRGSADELAPLQPGRTLGLRLSWGQG